MHLAQLLLGRAQNGHGLLRIRGRLNHRAEHSDHQMGDEIGAESERARSAEQSIGLVPATTTECRFGQPLPRQRRAGDAPLAVIGVRRSLQMLFSLVEAAGEQLGLAQHQ